MLEEPRRLVERTLPLPELGDDDGLLRVEACGLCGTDHEQYTGALNPGFAFVPGHEIVGVVEDVGPAAADRWAVEVGDRVAVEVFQSCRSCAACRAGEVQRCERHGLRDMYGMSPVARAPGLWGGYADWLYLAPDARVVRVPDGLDPVVATLFNPLGAGLRWGAELPGTGAGDVVAVLGPGVRGLAATAAARKAGAEFVLVTGVGPRDDERLALAKRFGADLTVDVSERDPVHALRDRCGRLADIVVDVTANAPAAFAQAMALARPGGIVIVAGTRGAGDAPGFSPDVIVAKELRVVGALGVDTPAYRGAFELLTSGRFPFAELPRRVEPLAGADGLLRALAGESDRPPVHGVLVPRP